MLADQLDAGREAGRTLFRQKVILSDLVVDDDFDIVVRLAGGINGLRKIIEPELCCHDLLDRDFLLYDMVNDLGDDCMVICRGTANNRLVYQGSATSRVLPANSSIFP